MDLDITAPELAALAAEIERQSGAGAYYVFWFGAGPGAGGGRSPARERTLAAFASPDGALAFAQRSVRRDGQERPRLRRLALPQLLQAVAREPAIAALLLIPEGAAPPPAGALPAGLRLDRAEILRRLAPSL